MPTTEGNKAVPPDPQSPSPSRGDASALVLSKPSSTTSLDDASTTSPSGLHRPEANEGDTDSEKGEGDGLYRLGVVSDDNDSDEETRDDEDDNGAEAKGKDEDTAGAGLKLSLNAGYGPRDEIDFRTHGFNDIEREYSKQKESLEEAGSEDVPESPTMDHARTPSPQLQPTVSREPVTPRAPTSVKSSPVRDSPLARTQNGQKYRFGSNTAEKRYLRFADEVSRVLVGPMPADTFLDEFLPAPAAEKVMPEYKGAFNAVPEKPQSEAEIYTPLIAAVNEKGRCPNVTFVDTSVSSDKGRGIYKPDVSGYDPDDIELLVPVPANRSKTGLNQSKATTEATRKQPTRRVRTMVDQRKPAKPARYCANLGLADTYFEIKMKGLDPFCDEHEHDNPKHKSFFSWKNTVGFDSNTATQSRKTLGQMAVYASEACARQHRMFYFSVLIIGPCARLFRWDRAGVIVTNAFDYRKQPELLCEFLWRFGNASAIQRGFDPTVTVASAEERGLFERIISEEVAFQLKIASDDTEELQKHLKFHYETQKVTKVLVHDRRSSKWEEHLVSVPVSSPRSFVGRCTRAYWSVRIIRDEHGGMRGEVAFLKDVWRVDVPKTEDEGSVYEDMQGKVNKIPGLLACGDVLESSTFHAPGQTKGQGEQAEHQDYYQYTRTQKFTDAGWVCSCLHAANDKRRIVKHTHFRLTLDEVGYSLKNFENSRELFEAGGDAFEALDSAYEQCKRLHRDVSLDNIILVRSRKTGRREGRLVDWEFSTIADRSGKARDYFRSGTWAFMSAYALDPENTSFKHSVENDLEALFYVLMYSSLLWLRHNKVEDLGRWMFNFFDNATVIDGRDAGGDAKSKYIAHPAYFTNKFKFDEPIYTWFKRLYRDLGTTASNLRAAGHRVKWTRQRFRKRMDVVKQGLEHVEGNDRVKHNVDDYHAPIPEVFRATHTSLMKSSIDLAALISGSVVSGHRSSKRSIEDDGIVEGGTSDGGSRKRSRMDHPDESLGP